MDNTLIARFLKETKIVRSPKQVLSAYGTTRLRYHLVSPIDMTEDKTRVREGFVVSERPLILTPEALKERFEGFGSESSDFTRWLSEQYQDLLRALEYKFCNKDFQARVLQDNSKAVMGRIQDDLAARSVQDTALISCPDAAWSLAIMKFTLDEASRAFPSHMRTYEEHGLFDPGAAGAKRQRREIESLFKLADSSPEARSTLGAKLKEYGLFAEYEDRFLALFR